MATLLDAGHDYSAVMDGYATDELLLHYHAVLRLRARQLENLCAAVRVAVNGTPEAYRSFLNRLESVTQPPQETVDAKDGLSIPNLIKQLKARGKGAGNG